MMCRNKSYGVMPDGSRIYSETYLEDESSSAVNLTMEIISSQPGRVV